MKITDITFHKETIPLKTPFVTHIRSTDTMTDYVVEIHTDSGLVGHGACAPTPVITGDTEGSIIYALKDYCAPRLVGKEVTTDLLAFIRGILVHNTSPKAALDIAIYDLLAQQESKTMLQYLGGGDKAKLRTDLTVSLGTPEKMVKDTISALNEGFTAIKYKLGTTKKDDMERIAAVAPCLPSDTAVRIDANQAWSAEDALDIIKYADSFGLNLELVEQPTPMHDIDGLEYVTKHSGVKILADESAFSYYDVKEILARQAADLINIKFMKCGGIYEALRIFDLCEENGVECMVGSMMEGPVSVAAACCFAAAKGITIIDLDVPVLCKEMPLDSCVKYNGPDITIETDSAEARFGLGIR